jgi:hypothetical protein
MSRPDSDSSTCRCAIRASALACVAIPLGLRSTP